MADRQTFPRASAGIPSAGSVSSAQPEKGAAVVFSAGSEGPSGRPKAEKSRDEGPSQSARGTRPWGGSKPPARSAGEFSGLANSKLEKEVYEYIPDAALSLAPQEAQSPSSLLPAVSSIASRPARAKGCDVDEQSLPPGVAFETFKGKTYETTSFGESVSYASTRRKEGQGVAHVSPGDGGPRSTPAFLFEMGNTGFETPLGRLQRLRMEVEEMLTFISSYPRREGMKAEAVPEEGAAGEVAALKVAGAEASTASRQIQPQAKETLLFGQDPQYLLSELGRLRMQILSVMNDPSLQQLFAGVEPISGRQSGGELLLQHLQEVQGSLEALQQTASSRAPQSGHLAPATPEQAKQAIPVPERSHADDAGGVPRADTGAVSWGTGSTSVQTDGMTQYDIYCVPSFTPLLESSRAAALERRLAHVERRIGMSKISLLPFPDLQQGIVHISQKLALLDANKVEQLHKRAQRLLHELHALQYRRRELDISGASAQLLETAKNSHTHSVPVEGSGYEGSHRETAAARAAAADDQRVEELFDICERWKVKAAALPSVVERLKALKALHREAGGISVRLQVLEEQQAHLQVIISSAEQHLEGLQKTVAETVAWAKTTVQTMQRRLQCLEPRSKDDLQGTKT